MESDTFNGRATLLPPDTLFTLLEKQAKEFETFGKRMSLDIQNSHKIYIQQYELTKNSDLDNILGKQQDQIESQSHLIDSLRSRIEELETDSIKKSNEIKKLKNEFLDFKKEIKLLFGLENFPQSLDPNNFKKGISLYEENDSDEFEFIHSEAKYIDSKSKQFVDGLTAVTDNNIRSNDFINTNNNNISFTSSVENFPSNERLIADNSQSNEIDIKNERLIFPNTRPKVVYGINEILPKDQNFEKMDTVVENKKTSIYGSVLFDEYFYNHATFTNRGESSASLKSSSNNNYNENDWKGIMAENGYRTIEFVLQQLDDQMNDQDRGISSLSKGKSKESNSKISIENHTEESTEESSSDHQLEDELEEDIKYNPSQHSSQNSNSKATQKLRDLLLDFKASELGLKESNNNINNVNLKDAFNYVTQTSDSQKKDNNISYLPPISVNPQALNGPSASTSSSPNKSVPESHKPPTIIEQLEAEIQYTIARFQEQNTRIKQKTFNYLLNQFTLDSLIKYQETTYYNALSRDPKRSIKLMVKTALRSELCNKDKRVTQPIEEYVKRKIIPSLPPGIKSYADYEKTSYFTKLSDEKKKRIRKIITVEHQ